ncbi:MAG: adenylate/guanylate cyclase domain-containing protein, partial [Pseudomonadota bacterium]
QDRARQRIIDWLLSEGRALENAGALLDAVARHLTTAGVRVDRATLHLPALHPQVSAVGFLWLAEEGIGERRHIDRQIQSSQTYHDSPIGLMHRSRDMVRRRLAGPEADLEFPLLEEIAGEGYTDYVLIPLPFGSGALPGFSVSTKDERGFSGQDIELLRAISPSLSAVAEVLVGRHVAGTLLDTYVGHEAGRRILEGQVTVGSSRIIDAIILFCDMRNFTSLSERLDSGPLLELLTDYFGCIVRPLRKAGGEVLKFMGDGMLSIFNLEQEEDVETACALAMIAALEAVQMIDVRNAERIEAGKVPFAAGIALHKGQVLYGNVGAEDRLDFTVIGPAVNRAARIESLCPIIGKPILTSRAFARACPVQLLSVGKHKLKGVPKPQEIFTPGLAAQI